MRLSLVSFQNDLNSLEFSQGYSVMSYQVVRSTKKEECQNSYELVKLVSGLEGPAPKGNWICLLNNMHTSTS